jgi:predicted branched-subunit amino acid permease
MTTQTVSAADVQEFLPLHDNWLRRAALRDILAVSPGVIPFGVMLGVTVVTTDTGALAGMLGAVLVYGGSAQLTAITVLHAGAGLLAAVLSGALVNARILLYSAALEPRFRSQPLWFRLVAPAFIQDQTYLSATGREEICGPRFRRYWAWLGGSLLVVWTSSVALGLAAGPLLPPLPHLGLVGTALFIAMLVPRLLTREAVLAAGVSLATAFVVARFLPELGILVGAAAGVLAATITGPRAQA